MNNYCVVFTLAILFYPDGTIGKNNPLASNARLYDDLMKGYDRLNPDKNLRPFPTTSIVDFGLSLKYFLDYNEETKIGTFVFWETHLWHDNYLRWSSEEYEGTTSLRIPIDKIWKPDIKPYDDPNPGGNSVDEYLPIVNNGGIVVLISVVKRQVYCPIDDSGFINCKMTFGSGTYDGNEIDIKLYDDRKEVDMTYYIENEDYNLIENTGTKNTIYYSCCEEPHPEVAFTLKFKNNSK